MLLNGLLAIVFVSSPAQVYKFVIDPQKTFTQGTIEIKFEMSGSFLGDFEPTKNPNGTRTKPGLAGDFGPLENNPVLARSFWSLSDSSDLHTGGSFQLGVDLANRKATLTSYVVERLAAGPMRLNATYRLNTELFRTLAPESIWGIETSPTGSMPVQLDRMKISQKAGSKEGTVTPLADGWYRVSVNFMADAQVDVLDFDQPGPLNFPVAASLVGNFRLTPKGATFGYPKGRANPKLHTANCYLPTLPLIDKFSLKINGLRQLSATGTLVPGP